MNDPKMMKGAVEGLYVAFSKYPLPAETRPCPDCHPPRTNDLLHAAPLRELQWDQLHGYATEALMVWGDLECYKHFLPRIFELTLTAAEWRKTPTPRNVFHVLRYGEWRTWPRLEQEAIERMLHAVWGTVLSNPPVTSGYIDVDHWLCCISQCEDDLSAYLDRWQNEERLSAAWALSCLVLGTAIAYTDVNTRHDRPVWEGTESLATMEEWHKLPHRGPFWKRCDAQYAQLQTWVQSPAALEKLHQAEMSCGHIEMAREFKTAKECLREAKSTLFEVVYRKRRFQTAYKGHPTYRLY